MVSSLALLFSDLGSNLRKTTMLKYPHSANVSESCVLSTHASSVFGHGNVNLRRMIKCIADAR